MKKIFLLLSVLVCMTLLSGCFTLVGAPGHSGGEPAIDEFKKSEVRHFHVTDIYGNTPLRDFMLQGYWADTPERSIYLSVNYERMCKKWSALPRDEKRKIMPTGIMMNTKNVKIFSELPKEFSKITENYPIETRDMIWVNTTHVKITGKAVGGLAGAVVADIITSPIQIPIFTVVFGFWVFKAPSIPPPPTWTREDIDAVLEKYGH